MSKHNNPRYRCNHCNARNTRNQLRGSNGICIYCKTAMPHTNWLGGQSGSIFQLISLSKNDEDLLKELASKCGFSPVDLIRASVQKSLTTWEQASDQTSVINADIILGKLSQR